MTKLGRPAVVLLAEDDDDEFLVIKKVFETAMPQGEGYLFRVKDGEELSRYLSEAARDMRPRPDLIFLDLNMPRKSGRETLQEIKSDPDVRQIPVIVLTTSGSEDDIEQMYDLGANSFIRKAVNFSDFVGIMRDALRYWCHISELPPRPFLAKRL